MLHVPKFQVPITEIQTAYDCRIFVKREDLIHPKISGNKFWKLFYNVNHYLAAKHKNLLIITFGGAFSNHIASVAAFGKQFDIPTMGVIRGEELADTWTQNPTLAEAHKNGMSFLFATRKNYADKEQLTEELYLKYPDALIIPEGGSNSLAAGGIQHMAGHSTEDFDYLCTAVGTGGTIAGISKYARDGQKVLGIRVVKDDSLPKSILSYGAKDNFELMDAHESRYGKISDDNIRFINRFYKDYHIPLDPIYTGKMMQKVFELAENGFFAKGSKVLAFHTGGLQGIAGANQFLKAKNKGLIDFENQIFD